MLELDGYTISEGSYHDDAGNSSNFLIELLGKKLHQKNSEWWTSYLLRIWMVSGTNYTMKVCGAEMNTGKWLARIPEAISVGGWTEKKKFTMAVINEVIKKKDIPVCETELENIGYYDIQGKKGFAFSNGSITVNGFEQACHAKIEGYNYYGKLPITDLQRMELFQAFAETICHSDKVFVPVFLMNILSVVRDFLSVHGIPSGITLWLDGQRGSGKTEVATTLGCIVDAGIYGQRKISSSTEKTTEVVKRLVESRGITFILDDIKKEAAQRQKQKSVTASDIVLRSIYQGRTTEISKNIDNRVSACGIITGEYFENSESQIARLLYMNLSGFLSKKKNSQALRILQNNRDWIPSLIGDFISWFLRMNEEPRFVEDTLIKWKLLQSGRVESVLPDYNRLYDAECLLRLGAWLYCKYIDDMDLNEMGDKLNFEERVNTAITNIIEETALVQNALEAIIVKAVKEILNEEFVAESSYKINSHYEEYRYKSEEFVLQDKEMFLLIPELNKSMELRLEKEADDEQDAVLLVDSDMLLFKLNKKIASYADNGEVPNGILKKVTPLKLAQMGIIYVSRRDDGHYRYSQRYPRIVWNHNYYVEEDSQVQTVGCWKCNLNHVCFETIIKKKRDHFGYDVELTVEQKEMLIKLKNEFFRKKMFLI